MTDRPYPSPASVGPPDALVSDGYSPPSVTGEPPSAPAPRHSDDPSGSNSTASATADAGKQAAGEVASTAADKAQDVAGEAKAQARNVLSEAQTQLQDQAKAQHGNLVSNLRSLADELSSMAGNADQNGIATRWVGEAGNRARSAADWMGDREPGQLVDEVRAFARRRPGTFVLGALAAGIAAGRLTRGVVGVHKEGVDGGGTQETDRSVGSVSAQPTGVHGDPGFLAPPTSQPAPVVPHVPTAGPVTGEPS
ncbi:hypothetical protein [Jatrophihabitans fulvus]